MIWRIEFDPAARKELARLDRNAAARILKFLTERLARLDDPRSLGDALKGAKLGDFWKYRVGDYRVIADINDHTITILVLRWATGRTSTGDNRGSIDAA